MKSLFTKITSVVSRTWNKPTDEDPDLRFYKELSHADRGLSGEVGELTDAIKRHLDYGRPLDVDNVEEEVGDILYYLSKICLLTGVTFDTAVDTVKVKLEKRYPNGFTVKDSITRADKSSAEPNLFPEGTEDDKIPSEIQNNPVQ